MLPLSALLLGLIFAVVVHVPSVAQQTGIRCPPAPGRSETCVCKTDKGVIDMTSLSNSDGSARYRNFQDSIPCYYDQIMHRSHDCTPIGLLVWLILMITCTHTTPVYHTGESMTAVQFM